MKSWNLQCWLFQACLQQLRHLNWIHACIETPLLRFPATIGGSTRDANCYVKKMWRVLTKLCLHVCISTTRGIVWSTDCSGPKHKPQKITTTHTKIRLAPMLKCCFISEHKPLTLNNVTHNNSIMRWQELSHVNIRLHNFCDDHCNYVYMSY